MQHINKSFNFLAFLFTTLLLVGCSGLRTIQEVPQTDILASIDLRNLVDDKAHVEIDPIPISTDVVRFYLPLVVPGTYENSNFGRFITDFKALDKNGVELPVSHPETNTWVISNAKNLDKLHYWVEDTFDGEMGQDIYPMGGTNFIADQAFMLNLHSIIGYFEGKKEIPYQVKINSPKTLNPHTSLARIQSSDSLDVFRAQRYFQIIDNPVLYTKEKGTYFDLDNIKVGLAIYSPSDTHRSSDYQAAIQKMMTAQKNFLGAANNTPVYNVLIDLMDYEELQFFGGMMGALEHHTSTTVVFFDGMEKAELEQSLIDVVSHEFFHTLTPLNVHSEEIHNFDYNQAIMSQHLWMYEGTTEYFSNLFQINQGLIDDADFFDRIMEKIDFSSRYDDQMSFTEMSKNIVEEPYQANYGNVYQKGALINMCLDIIIREQSGGSRGILSVMKALAQKYGSEKPFQDAALIDEIIAMTYPEVGQFFEQHVVGTTPIDYATYFEKVGLTYGTIDKNLPSILLVDGQRPFFTVQMSADGKREFLVSASNSSLDALGIQEGDLLVELEGNNLDNPSPESGAALNQLFRDTFSWKEDKDLTMTVMRDGEKLTLTGKVGKPSVLSTGIISKDSATTQEVALREAWLRD
jgi:predicted metalloprotease with PDZ domain